MRTTVLYHLPANMFVVTTIEDNIRVHPSELSKPPLKAVSDVIEKRYVDKVVANLGLVVTLYDVLDISGGFIYPNDGAANFKVKFRVVVFRPFPGEIIVGKLVSCTKTGIKISLGFFEDILVPEYALQDPSFFDDSEKLWVWKFDGNDMYMDLQEEVRFRVHSVKFNSIPTPAQLLAMQGDDKLIGTAARPFAPMEVIGDINGDGLGLSSWWAPVEDA